MKAETILNSKPSINGQMNDLFFEYADVIECMKEYAKDQIEKDRERIKFNEGLSDSFETIIKETPIILD